MSEHELLKEFQKFGERFFIIFILMLLSIFVDFFRFVAFIIFLYALANIKTINQELEDKNLRKFRSKTFKSMWVAFASVIITGVAAGVAAFLWFTEAPYIMYLIPANILVYGIIVLFLSIAAQKKAWHKLHKFFDDHSYMFPKHVAVQALEGTEKLEKACKYTMYIITIPVAVIYYFIGLYKLATLRQIPLYYDEIDRPSGNNIPKQHVKEEFQRPEVETNYCPSCGKPVSPSGRYCALCGFDLVSSKTYS